MPEPALQPFHRTMSKDRRLVIVLLINAAMILALVAVGLLAGSLGVLAAGADYLGDAVGVAISLAALRMSRHPHGHPRATSIAALFNATFLLLVTTAVAVAAVRRLAGGAPEVHGLPVLAVSAVAVLAMLLCAAVIGRTDADDLNLRSVMLDALADAGAGAGVALSGTIILLAGGLYWLDPLVALVVSVVVAYHAIRLVLAVRARLREISAARP